MFCFQNLRYAAFIKVFLSRTVWAKSIYSKSAQPADLYLLVSCGVLLGWLKNDWIINASITIRANV